MKWTLFCLVIFSLMVTLCDCIVCMKALALQKLCYLLFNILPLWYKQLQGIDKPNFVWIYVFGWQQGIDFSTPGIDPINLCKVFARLQYNIHTQSLLKEILAGNPNHKTAYLSIYTIPSTLWYLFVQASKLIYNIWMRKSHRTFYIIQMIN